MNDDLLKRADQALRDNQFIKAQCLGNLKQSEGCGRAHQADGAMGAGRYG